MPSIFQNYGGPKKAGDKVTCNRCNGAGYIKPWGRLPSQCSLCHGDGLVTIQPEDDSLNDERYRCRLLGWGS